jgi:hypothetical protein
MLASRCAQSMHRVEREDLGRGSVARELYLCGQSLHQNVRKLWAAADSPLLPGLVVTRAC